MNLEAYREHIRTVTGLTERGTKGDARLNLCINLALRHLWSDMPERYKRAQYRFMLEPPVTGSASIDHDDPHAFLVLHAGTWPDDGTMSARWIEFYRDGQWIQRRVREVVDSLIPLCDHVIIDDPWDNLTDDSLPCRIFTKDYPYTHDAERVEAVLIDPENDAEPLLPSTTPRMLDLAHVDRGWRTSGDISEYGEGDFFQLPAPHYGVVATLITPDEGVYPRWGYDPLGDEHGGGGYTGHFYGPAGTFKYLVCHVWGRRKWLHPTKGWDYLAPFYISAPSDPSDAITTNWGVNHVRLILPNVAYTEGFGPDNTFTSFEHSGIERWIFRSRSASEATGGANHAVVQTVENDNLYYLWAIAGDEEVFVDDYGQYDPVDRYFPLGDFHGHHSLRFDVAPVAAKPVLLDYKRRPPTVDYDTDTISVPPEFVDALFHLVCAYIVGFRDGELNRATTYYKLYLHSMERFTVEQNQPGFGTLRFGNGIQPGRGDYRRNVPTIREP